MDKVKYLNDMVVRLEELMFQELSGMCCWKVEFVGVDLIRSKQIEGKTVDEVVQSCSKEIVAEGIAKDISYKVGGKGVMLKLKMKDCIHLPKEAQLKKDGVAPYICPIANMILDQIHEKLHYETSYLAKLATDENKKECIAYAAIYETPEKIAEVSDWLKDDEDVAFLKNQPSQILPTKKGKQA
jgi:hypothetical protein